MTLDFNQYQIRARQTAIYPGQGGVLGLCYVALGLGERGEVQGKVKKILRDNDNVITDDAAQAIAKELGDVLWYVSQMCSELGIPLEAIAEGNLAKLADRARRGALGGNGDNR